MDLLQQYLSNRIQEPLILPTHTLSLALEALETEGKRVEMLEDQQAKIAASLKLSHHRIATIRNLLTPIRRVPPEVLTEIFLHYVQLADSFNFRLGDAETKKRWGFLIHLPPILVLSQVCWSWRRIIQVQPCLWAELKFSTAGRSPDPALFKEWLRRSGGLPLDIHIRSNYLHRSKPSDGFLDALSFVSMRWRRLHLQCFHMIDIHRLLNRHDFHTPLLEEISLGTSCFPMGYDSLSVIDKAPRLVAFKVDSNLDGSSQIQALGSRITHLNLSRDEADPSDALVSLRFCHLLQECSFHLTDFPNPHEAPSIEVTSLPHLRILELEFVGEFGCPQILDGLKLPSLTELTIEHNFYPEDDGSELGESDILWENRISPISHMIGLYRRSRFGLLDLRLDTTTGMNTEELLDFLRQTSSLRTLDLQYCRLDTDAFVQALQVSKSMAPEEIFLPHLLKLEYIDIASDLERREDGCCIVCRLRSLKSDYPVGRISHLAATRFDPRVYSGGESNDWQESWPVSRLQDGLVVSRRALLNYYTDDFSDEFEELSETDRLKALEKQGMPLKIM
ncbi:hypothetical protein VKT23_007902 [Stygiomarasmius scandens]|uniref:F-box domain-containing protein n=1 Tax=Marasmiellus scandens TaxID=2682957 RepID=A0ABR1JIQ7_9AGAR